MRHLAAAFAASTASAAIPVALGLWVFMQGPGIDPSGRPDNAPYRAAAFLLMLMPAFVVVGAVWYAVSAWTLRRLGRLTLGSLIVLSCIASLILGFVFAAEGVGIDGLRDAVLSFGLFGGIAFVCLSLGECVWWLLRPAP